MSLLRRCLGSSKGGPLPAWARSRRFHSRASSAVLARVRASFSPTFDKPTVKPFVVVKPDPRADQDDSDPEVVRDDEGGRVADGRLFSDGHRHSAVRANIPDEGGRRFQYEYLRTLGVSHTDAALASIDLTPHDFVPVSRSYQHRRSIRAKSVRDTDKLIREFEQVVDDYVLEEDRAWDETARELDSLDPEDAPPITQSSVPSYDDMESLRMLAQKYPMIHYMYDCHTRWTTIKLKNVPHWFVANTDHGVYPDRMVPLTDGKVPNPLTEEEGKVLHFAQLQNLRFYLQNAWRKERAAERAEYRPLEPMQLDPKTPHYETRNQILQLLYHDLNKNPYLESGQKHRILFGTKNMLENQTMEGKRVMPAANQREVYAKYLQGRREKRLNRLAEAKASTAKASAAKKDDKSKKDAKPAATK